MIITLENVQEAHQLCLRKCEQERYFPSIINKIVDAYGGHELSDPSAISEMWTDIWAALPDDISIHKPPFYLICDLAESEYLDIP